MSEKEKNLNTGFLTDKLICIIGPLKLQNELMASFLMSETQARCLLGEDAGSIPEMDTEDADGDKLILWDSMGKDPNECLAELEQDDNILKRHFVALFNVSPGYKNEENAVARGVRGFFYEQAPLELFPKGIRAIFEGELWVSREILTKYILKNKREDFISTEKENVLTPREIEILTMISVGAKNEDIGTCQSK